MVKLLVASLLAAAVVAMGSTSAASVACSARIGAGDAAVGIDLITDATCETGGLGCLGTVCRFCKRRSTPESDHLLSCPTTAPSTTPAVTTASASPTTPSTIASTAECDALLSVGDKAVGILTARDTSCATGGVGCITSNCRYCQAQTTPQSKHLLMCTAISSSAATAPTTTVGTPVAHSPTATTTTVAASACTSLLASGDRDVGISIASDMSCASAGGVGCVGNSTCRFCRVLETPQSKHLQLCSAIVTATTTTTTTVKGLQAAASNNKTSDEAGTGLPLLPVGAAVGAAAAVALVAVAVKRARDRTNDDVLVTPTNVIHRNQPLCTI